MGALLLKMLEAEVCGFFHENGSTLVSRSAVGESILADRKSLNEIVAREYKESKSFLPIRCFIRYFKFDYLPIPLQINQKLPPWLTVTIENDVVYFKGTPTISDIGEYMIQVIDESEYVL